MINKHFYLILIILGYQIISACSGKEGDPGPQGLSGPQGIQGIKGEGGPTDKQLRFSLPSAVVFSNTPYVSGWIDNIYKFNIDNYEGIDSVIYTIWSEVPNPGNKCTIELINITDDTVISGSLIEVMANAEMTQYQSGNLVSAFPKKEITIGIRLKGQNPDQFANAVGGYLYLYRH